MNTANVQIGDWLGVQSPATETEILRIVEGRLAPSIINRLVGLGLERSEIDAIIIPLRTLQHRRSRREKLTIEESDRVLRVIRALSLAESVYRKPRASLRLAAQVSSTARWPHTALTSEDRHGQPDCRRAADSD